MNCIDLRLVRFEEELRLRSNGIAVDCAVALDAALSVEEEVVIALAELEGLDIVGDLSLIHI